MSQHFELIGQLETELGSGSVAPRNTFKVLSAVATPQDSSFNQELLNLAQSVFLSGEKNAPRTVVLCGVDDLSRSSEICLQLGRILANASTQPVCLIDGDSRSLQLHSLLNESIRPISFGDDPRQVEKHLWLASLESANSAHRDRPVQVDQIRQYLERLRQSFDFILIDAPGVNARSDAAVLSQACDGAILIIEANSTRKVAAMKAKKALQATNARLLGCVLNNRTFPIPEKLYRKL